MLKFSLYAVLLALAGSIWLNVAYVPVREGDLYLERANSSATLVREGGDSGIHHIRADDLQMAVYMQGFAHAQDRLWQMEKHRRVCQGRLSEVLGKRALHIDKFYLVVGLQRAAELTWNHEGEEGLTDEDRVLVQAYADGVNDYLDGVGLLKGSSAQTAAMLPPEFIALGITKVEPWKPTDSLALARMTNFGLSQNWSQELLRKIFRDLEKDTDADVSDLVPEMVPFNSEFMLNLTTVLSEEELASVGLVHPEGKTLLARYKDREEVTAENEAAQAISQEAKAAEEAARKRQQEEDEKQKRMDELREQRRLAQERAAQEEQLRIEEARRQQEKEEEERRRLAEEERLKEEIER